MDKTMRGWRRVKLGDIVEVVTEYWDKNNNRAERFVAGEHLDEGDLRIRRWGMTSDDLVPPTFNRTFMNGDVLFHSRNLQKLAQPNFSGVTGEKLFVLRSRSQSVLLQDLLPFLLQNSSFREYTERMWAGSTNKFLNKEPLINYELLLPTIEDQLKLSKALRAASDLSNNLRIAATVGSQAYDALVVKLYSEGARNEKKKQTKLGLIPCTWSIEPLGNRFSIQLGKMISENARKGKINDGKETPYLRNANVQWNRFDLHDVTTMKFTDKEREKFSLRVGDILACEGRHVGKSAIWRNEITGACYQKALHRIRALRDDAPDFLLHCLYSLSVTGRLNAHTSGTTIPHLPAEKLRAIEIAFPTIEEQWEIANATNSFVAGLGEIANRLDSSLQLSRSLSAELS